MSKKTNNDFRNLSWFDLQQWAGSRVVLKGKDYQQNRLVEDLAITQSGDLLSWVRGSSTYATKVSIDKGSLASVCTCPYYGPCKHAVALVLEYLDFIKNNKDIPSVSKKDERLLLLEGGEEDIDDPDDGKSDHEATEGQINCKPQDGVDDYLENKSKKELLSIINGILSRNPEIREDLNYKAKMARGKPSELSKTVEREILKATMNPGWRNHWKHTGYTPDYSHVKSGLEKLLDDGYADEVVRLGKKLFSKGISQVEQSGDEGETAWEISDAMKIVFKALGECSLSNVEKMEMAVDFKLSDEYDLCPGLDIFWNRRFSKKDWDTLADRLLKRLSKPGSGSSGVSFSHDPRRFILSNEIVRALENAGRHEEMTDLCIKEAETSGSYVRLVQMLRKAGRVEEAEAWILKGIAVTSNKLPGIASSLRDELLDIRSIKKDWAYVAALHADEFINYPRIDVFETLKKFSEKAGVWPSVREAVLHFLEAGEHLKESPSGWPLPDTGIEEEHHSRVGEPPYANVLVDVAIYENRTEDVLKWFEVCKKKGNNSGDHIKDNVAAAIADEYPDRAVALWKELAEEHLSVTDVSSYGMAAKYLRKAQKIIKQGPDSAEWGVYLQGLKNANRRRPRCIEILNALSQRPIIQSEP